MRKILSCLLPFLWLAAIPILLIVPRFKRKIVFGSWEGDLFADNPKYLALYLSNKHLARCIWIGKSHLRKDVEAAGLVFVQKGSLQAFWHLLTASWYVYCISLEKDIGLAPNCGRAKLLNLWHGIPYKRIGRMQGGHSCRCAEEQISWIRKVYRKFFDWVYKRVFPSKMATSVSSVKMGEIMCESWPSWFAKENIIYCGMPRCDIMIESVSNPKLQKRRKNVFAKRFGWPLDKRWYLYLPTWRGNEIPFSFAKMKKVDELRKVLASQNAVIIEKHHHSVLNAFSSISAECDEGIIQISKAQADLIDIQDLMISSDRLITDYSSCFFDYELLNRPVIHYVYDFDDYEKKLAGTNYNLSDIAGGPIVKTEEELLNSLCLTDLELIKQSGLYAREPLEFESGQACKKIAIYMGLERVSA